MEDTTSEPLETTPLLGDSAPLRESPSPRQTRPKPNPWHTILSAAGVLMILNVGSYVSLAASTAILQDIVCDKYWDHVHPVPTIIPFEDRCKIEPVQSEVAYINGWKDVFEVLPAITLAVPYGTLADRIGRKKVLLLAIIGCFMNDVWVRLVYWLRDTFPVRAVWLGGLWQLIGAGAATLSSISHVMVADVCPVDQRTTAFSQIQSAHLLAQFLFVPIGGYLVSINPWIPMVMSSIFMIFGFFGALFLIPETLPSITENSPRDNIPHLDQQNDNAKAGLGLYLHINAQLTTLFRLGRWARKNVRLILVVLCFFAYQLGHQAEGSLLLQYASKRTGWSLGKASYLISLGAGVNLVVHALLIPGLSSFLLHHLRLHEISKDKLIAQISGAFLAIGSSIIFLATSWVGLVAGECLASLGLAFPVPARSVVTSMVPKDHLAALYTAISVLSYAAMVAGGPLLASSFHWGMQLGDFWVGMPFLISAVCFIVALLAVSVVSNLARDHDPTGDMPGEETDSDES
ncbi:MFS general substrate transporter [Hypoxylon cercidicola]|nr:MFS general substrate transporter [Hypoxylon cercidicola]